MQRVLILISFFFYFCGACAHADQEPTRVQLIHMIAQAIPDFENSESGGFDLRAKQDSVVKRVFLPNLQNCVSEFHDSAMTYIGGEKYVVIKSHQDESSFLIHFRAPDNRVNSFFELTYQWRKSQKEVVIALLYNNPNGYKQVPVSPVLAQRLLEIARKAIRCSS